MRGCVMIETIGARGKLREGGGGVMVGGEAGLYACGFEDTQCRDTDLGIVKIREGVVE